MIFSQNTGRKRHCKGHVTHFHDAFDKPGRMGEMWPPYLTPCGNHMARSSPTRRPNAAPILNTGIKMPDGTGSVDATTDMQNCRTGGSSVRNAIWVYCGGGAKWQYAWSDGRELWRSFCNWMEVQNNLRRFRCWGTTSTPREIPMQCSGTINLRKFVFSDFVLVWLLV